MDFKIKNYMSSIKEKNEVEKIVIILWASFIFSILGLISFYAYGYSDLSFLEMCFNLIFIVVTHIFVIGSFKKLQYSFWTFVILISIYCLYGFINSYFIYEANYASTYFFLASCSLIIAMKRSYNPIFFPIVNWWTYDFRFRYDIEAKIEVNNKLIDSRLTDLRKKAGCIVFFEELEISKIYELKTTHNQMNINLKFEVVSKRVKIIGRPYEYGIRFILDDKESKSFYKELKSSWSIIKKTQAFKMVNNVDTE